MLSIAHTELKARCMRAAVNGFSLGKAATYVADLQAVVGVPALPPGVVPNSPAHILVLLDMMDKGVRAPKAVKAAPAPVSVAAQVESVAEVKVEPAPEKAVEKPAKKKGK